MSAESHQALKQKLLKSLCDADALRDANEMLKVCMMLLLNGCYANLGEIEKTMRFLNLNAHLVAVSYEPYDLPPHTKCYNPFRIQSSFVEHNATNVPHSRFDSTETQYLMENEHNCTFYVSVNLEGEHATQTEYQQRDIASVQDNISRLSGDDCGFLTMNSQRKDSKSIGWQDSLTRFAGDVQRADDQTSLLTRVDSCTSCGRMKTATCELRALGCCSPSFVCSAVCWERHMESEHPDVQSDGAQSNDVQSNDV